jgi:predicted transport protein
MNKTFSNLYKTIQKDKYIESVKASLQLLESYKRFPTDSEFEKEIVMKDVYNFRSRNYLLSKLENFKRKELVNVDNYTIEHVMPQNSNLSQEWRSMLGENWKAIQENYLHTIGNLTLTAYNSELSDRPFKHKKTIEGGFNDSPIRLNDFLRKTEFWREEDILNRAKELSVKAINIWKSAVLTEEQLEYYRPEVKSSATYSIDAYDYLKGDMIELYEALKKRILNIDSSVHEEYKKLYIAYKSSTNFVDIVPQKSRLRLSLNIAFSDITDPKGYCKDITGLGRWGNGDVEVAFENLNQLDDIMELIEQAFDKLEEL